MNRIEFRNVLPNVFAHQEHIESQVWCQPSVVFQKGSTYLVEASSGTGKSTMCSYMTGYRNDYTGEILFDNTPVRELSRSQWTILRQKHISHLYQELRLFPELTALENVLIKNRLTAHLSQERIEELFGMLGILDKLNSRIGQMSFGQQQRVALIRALAQPFDFIILDEPISHLDEQNSHIMGDIVTAEAKRQGAGIIVTSIGKHMDLPYDEVVRL